MDYLYLQTHLKLLLSKLAESYIKKDFEEYKDLRNKINQTRELMNDFDHTTLRIQIPKTSTEIIDDSKFS
jgi:hypothetical protein